MAKLTAFVFAFLIMFSSAVFSDHCLTRLSDDDDTCTHYENYIFVLIGILALAFAGFVIYMSPRKIENPDLNAELARIDQMRKSGQITDAQAVQEKDKARSKFVRSQPAK